MLLQETNYIVNLPAAPSNHQIPFIALDFVPSSPTACGAY